MTDELIEHLQEIARVRKADADDVEREASWYFYNCGHGASNAPCPKCHGTDAEIMPADWMKTYVAPVPPGLTDSVAVV